MSMNNGMYVHKDEILTDNDHSFYNSLYDMVLCSKPDNGSLGNNGHQNP